MKLLKEFIKDHCKKIEEVWYGYEVSVDNLNALRHLLKTETNFFDDYDLLQVDMEANRCIVHLGYFSDELKSD